MVLSNAAHRPDRHPARWLYPLALIGLLLGSRGILVAASDQQLPQHVRQVDIVHMTHTDVGFTDHPLVCREQQVRYLDIAIDAVLATREKPPEQRFYWTAETTLAVDDWWQRATPARRQELLQAVASGQLEIAALPMNQTPTLNAAQWHTMLHWLAGGLVATGQAARGRAERRERFSTRRGRGPVGSRRAIAADGHQSDQWRCAAAATDGLLVENA